MIGILVIGSLFWHMISASYVDPTSDQFFFSNTITQANAKFVAACHYANGSLENMTHPERGSQNETLQTIVCVVGNSSARSAVYTLSGTHGIEGFAGSMAQISMLRGPPSMYPAGIRMVHVHMLNPYGASHIYKENEQNADQFKNVAGYYALGYDNPIAQELMDGIDWPNLGNATTRQNTMLFFQQLLAKYGSDAVNRALKTGQGKRPQGIAYFGPSKSWSSNTHEYVVMKYLKNIENLLLIDWHTAVGPYGDWTFLPIDDETEKSFISWVQNGLVMKNDVEIPTGGEKGYTGVQRSLNLKKFRRGFWEAGTYNVTMDTNAMFILRLYCRFYSNPNDPLCQQIIQQTREYFYPQSADWKNMTYYRINELLPKLLSGFASEVKNGAVSCLSNVFLLIIILAFSFSHYF